MKYIDLNALDNGGWTTFMLANGYGQQDVVKCLPDHLSGTIRKLIWMSKTMAEMNSILRQIFTMVVCDDEWNWPSFLALPINSVLFEECTRNGLIKCAMMLLWLLPARVSLLTFAGSTRRWCYEMLQVMQYFSNSQVTIWAAETLPEMTPSIKLQITFLFRLLAAARRDQFFF